MRLKCVHRLEEKGNLALPKSTIARYSLLGARFSGSRYVLTRYATREPNFSALAGGRTEYLKVCVVEAKLKLLFAHRLSISIKLSVLI
jgi:hypothetical protein